MTESQRLAIDDDSVVAELARYIEALEEGERPDRQELLRRFPEIGEELAACLDGLDLVHRIATPLRDGSLDTSEPAAPLGDFRILREAGRGGMGVVYEAEQMSLGRRVALKVLPFAAVLDARYLRRFKNEAQAAAHLHHTNIVPVYAVGCDRGVHYYAMQFIEGPTVAGLIDELRGFAGNGEGRDSSPALQAIAKDRTSESPQYCRAVANLGIQAAEALDYAHESGVIHRDIKPSNLIVDGEGHLWITDLGLASTRNDTGLTMTGDIVGTLRYMSPEQALAKRGPVDHRTDIYSLAVTLYELLTLKQAFLGDDAAAVMSEIAFKEPTKPRALNPATPVEDRYATAKDLADDLRRFLEDRPIHARRPGVAKRAAQWARRHRPVMWAAASVLVLAVIGLAVSTALILERAREAERNFESWRRIVDTMLTRVAEALENQPHQEQLRRELLEMALQNYLRFLELKGDAADVRYEVARAHRRVGEIYEMLGRSAEAEQAYERAVGVFESLAAESPGSSDLRHQIACTLYKWGDLLQFTDQDDEAERTFRRSLSISEGLLTERSPHPGHLECVASSRLQLGGLLDATARPKEAEQNFLRARKLFAALHDKHPENRVYQRGLAHVSFKLARQAMNRGDFAEAARLADVARSTLERLVSKSGTAAERVSLHHAVAMQGAVYEEEKRWNEAEQAYRKSASILEELTRDYPSVPDYRCFEALMQYSLAKTYRNLKRLEDGKRAARRALEILAPLTKTHPKNTWYAFVHAMAHEASYHVHLAEEPERAVQNLRSAIEMLDRLEPDLRRDEGYRVERARAYYNLGSYYVKRGKWNLAEKPLRSAIDGFQELANAYPDAYGHRDDLGWCHTSLAATLEGLQRFEEATRSYREAKKHRKWIFDKFPQDARYRRNLYEAHLLLGYRLAITGQVAASVPEWRAAIALDPKQPHPLWSLALALLRCPDPKVRNPAESVKLAQRAIELAPKEPLYRSTLGEALALAGDKERAVQAYRKAIELGADSAWIFNNVAWALVTSVDPAPGDVNEAVDLAKRAVAKEPKHAGYWHTLGFAHDRKGNPKEAVDAFRTAVELAPNEPEFLNDLAWILVRRPDSPRQDAEEAVRLAEHAVKHSSERDPRILNTLGVAQYRASEWKGAVKALEQSLELEPQSPAYDWIFLAMAHFKLQKEDAARAAYDKAVAWIAEHPSKDADLERFRAEAEEVLGIEGGE
ncbi:MAG: tetratricopeptide repeat protein [Planctomycetota bacterium]|jgi:serine/threonine protein kinase/cytochrome c-type biogenesis protein CcmH/NrfG